MNIGTIDQIYTGELVVNYHYTNERGQQLMQQLSLHPFFKKYPFQINEQVKFQYALECEEHYPTTCTCERVRLYALPIMTKERKSLLKLIIKHFKKNG